MAQRVVVGGADGRAEGQRTLSRLSGSFSQLKLQLHQLVQLTCQAKSMRWAGLGEGCSLMDKRT